MHISTEHLANLIFLSLFFFSRAGRKPVLQMAWHRLPPKKLILGCQSARSEAAQKPEAEAEGHHGVPSHRGAALSLQPRQNPHGSWPPGCVRVWGEPQHRDPRGHGGFGAAAPSHQLHAQQGRGLPGPGPLQRPARPHGGGRGLGGGLGAPGPSWGWLRALQGPAEPRGCLFVWPGMALVKAGGNSGAVCLPVTPLPAAIEGCQGNASSRLGSCFGLAALLLTHRV